MAIFHCYVSSPEGIHFLVVRFPFCCWKCVQRADLQNSPESWALGPVSPCLVQHGIVHIAGRKRFEFQEIFNFAVLFLFSSRKMRVGWIWNCHQYENRQGHRRWRSKLSAPKKEHFVSHYSPDLVQNVWWNVQFHLVNIRMFASRITMSDCQSKHGRTTRQVGFPMLFSRRSFKTPRVFCPAHAFTKRLGPNSERMACFSHDPNMWVESNPWKNINQVLVLKLLPWICSDPETIHLSGCLGPPITFHRCANIFRCFQLATFVGG